MAFPKRTRERDDAARNVEPRPRDAASARTSALVGAGALATYLLLAPSVPGDKDSGELTLVLAFDGVAHPTGYPLYTLLGHAFTKLLHALGANLAYAANAWSALGGAIAIAFLHALAARLVPPSTPRRGRLALRLLPVALFALNPVWTVETTVAEVYSWHVAWVFGTILFFATLTPSLENATRWPRARLIRHAALWGFLCGLGGAHHVSAIYVAAPLSILLAVRLLRLRRLDGLLVVSVFASAVLPLFSYLLLLGKSAHPGVAAWGNLAPGWRGLLAHVTGRQYQFLLGGFDPSPVQRGLLAAYVFPFLLPGLVLLLATAFRARTDAYVLRAIALVAMLQTVAAFGYAASDPSSYFLAPMALGVLATVPAAAAALHGLRRRGLERLAVTLAAASIVILQVPWVHTGISRRDGYERFDEVLHSMWETIPYERGFVLWGDDLFARLRAYQLFDGEKPGLDVINPWWLFFPPMRARFTELHGYDPVEGISVPAEWLRHPPPGAPPLERILDDLAHRINDHTDLPVIVFDGEKRSVRLLKKSGVVPSAGDDDLQRSVLTPGQ